MIQKLAIYICIAVMLGTLVLIDISCTLYSVQCSVRAIFYYSAKASKTLKLINCIIKGLLLFWLDHGILGADRKKCNKSSSEKDAKRVQY